jgi:spermidine/putrescine transport system permease protein
MLLRVAFWLIMAFLLAPLAIIVLFSFHSSQALSFPFQGFSLRWYADMVGSPQLIDSILTSLIVAFGTAVITLILGLSASLAWLRLQPKARTLLEALTITPIALPGLFVGVALLIGFSIAHVRLDKLTIIIAHVVISLPVMMIAMRARLELFDSMLEEASRDLGANSIQTFRRITLPLILPTLISAAMLTFAISLDEFVVTGFVNGTETTLPMFIWSMMRRTVTPLINAISTVILIATLAILFTSNFIEQASRRRQLRGRSTQSE